MGPGLIVPDQCPSSEQEPGPGALGAGAAGAGAGALGGDGVGIDGGGVDGGLLVAEGAPVSHPESAAQTHTRSAAIACARLDMQDYEHGRGASVKVERVVQDDGTCNSSRGLVREWPRLSAMAPMLVFEHLVESLNDYARS